MTVSPPTRSAVDSFDHAGLFLVAVDRTKGVPASKTLEPELLRPQGGRVTNDRHKAGLHRYCEGCSRETEHVLSARDGRGGIPMRWSAAIPVSGTTICLDCGEWRTASFQPEAPAWSEWPRARLATQPVADAVAFTDNREAPDSETAAENEGMPPKAEPRFRATSARMPGLLRSVRGAPVLRRPRVRRTS